MSMAMKWHRGSTPQADGWRQTADGAVGFETTCPVASRRHENRIAQCGVRQMALQHAHDLPIPDPIEPRRVRRDACVQLPLYFGDESAPQHLIDASRQAAMQHLTRDGQLNVPGAQRSALARLALPPRERVSG